MKNVRFLVIFLIVALVATFYAPMAQAQDFSPFGFFTWLLGSIWSRPKNFERPEGAYLTLKLRTPERLVSVLGPTVIVDPSSRLGRMCEAGLKLYSLSDFNWVTDADVDFHKSRDTCVEKATVEVSFNPQTKATSNVTKKMVLWREDFENSNGAEIRVFPPKTVATEVSKEWQKVLSHSKETGDLIILTVTVYVDKPTKIKGSQSFQVFVCPTQTLSKIMGYQKDSNGLGVAIADANRQEYDLIRQEKGLSVKVLVKKNNALIENFRPVGLTIFDSLGEVHRGEVENGQVFKVVPEIKSGTIRITQLENETPLGMIPETLIDKDGRQTGIIRVSDNTELAVYPIENFSTVSRPTKLRGQIKIYAQKGSRIPLEFSAVGEGNCRTIADISRFGGKVIDVWTDKVQTEMIIKAIVGGREYIKKITPTNNQIVFNFESITPVRNYATINVNPAVRGGINSKGQLRNYANTSHFGENVAVTGVDPKEIQIFREQIARGECGYTVVGPEVRTFWDNGKKITSVNLIKSLTECGPSGRPIGHQNFYNTTFKSYHRVWVPVGRYGWVPGIISTCGNAVMVYITPPTVVIPPAPPALTVAPPPETPMIVSWDSLVISVANVQQGNLVITPSSISSYVPQTKIDIRNSQSQYQGQHQTSSNVNNNNNVNNNVNNNTNVNNNVIDVTNNNINQNQQILNNANANSN